MDENKKEIIRILTEYLEQNPDLRFTQALFNLNINEFADKSNPPKKDFMLRDVYSDTDNSVLKRMKSS